MYVLSHRVHDVGYFRPFVNDEWDPRLQLMREVFALRDTPESMCGWGGGFLGRWGQREGIDGGRRSGAGGRDSEGVGRAGTDWRDWRAGGFGPGDAPCAQVLARESGQQGRRKEGSRRESTGPPARQQKRLQAAGLRTERSPQP